MSGTIVATQACPAFQSFRKQTNPGGAGVVAGTSYRVTAANTQTAQYYAVVVPGFEPAQRWVAASCFGTSARADAPATHVLTLGWEPQFCLGHADRSECAGVTARSSQGHQLSLHGLWPQPIGKSYCNVTDRALIDADKHSDWNALPEPQLSAGTRAALEHWMPGVHSGLERHEWIKHGTCFGGSAEAYFQRAIELTRQVNQSPVVQLFDGNAGRFLSADQIRQVFDSSFGQGAGLRVKVSCSRGPTPRIAELVVSLAGDVAGNAGVGELIEAAAPVSPGCPGGLVVPPR